MLDQRTDILGLGVNWGDPAIDGLRNQTTAEVFYRFQIAKNFAFTPSVQYLKDPALNPAEDGIWIVGFRARFTL